MKNACGNASQDVWHKDALATEVLECDVVTAIKAVATALEYSIRFDRASGPGTKWLEIGGFIC